MLVAKKLVNPSPYIRNALNKMKVVKNEEGQMIICTLNNVTQNIQFNVTNEDQLSNIN